MPEVQKLDEIGWDYKIEHDIMPNLSVKTGETQPLFLSLRFDYAKLVHLSLSFLLPALHIRAVLDDLSEEPDNQFEATL